jgi:hypothetical protein
MRVQSRALSGLGAGLGDYLGTAPVTLMNGRIITDPANTPPGGAPAQGFGTSITEDCVPYICGADSTNQAAHYWCSYWGQAGSEPCHPECAKFTTEGAATCDIAIVSGTPSFPQGNNAQVTRQVAAAMPASAPATLTPQSIVSPLPDITLVLEPMTTPVCSDWDSLNGWIANNPLLAAGLAVGVFAIIYHCQSRKR